MVSKMSLTAQKTSPSLMDSPASARVSESLARDMESPTTRVETLSALKKRPVFDVETKGENRNTNLHKIAEDASTSPANAITTTVSPTRNPRSISRRRGYRPLSVRIGEAFNPFSSRESKSDRFELTDKTGNPAEGSSRGVLRGLALSKKVNWSENQDPHIFNANFVATLTSQRESNCVPIITYFQLTKESSSGYRVSSSI